MNTNPNRAGCVFILAVVACALAACARRDSTGAPRDAALSGGFDGPPGRIEFEGRNLFRRVPHTFGQWKFVRVEPEKRESPEAWYRVEVEIEVDTASVDTGSAWLNERARSEDFLDVDRYPTARIRIGNVSPAAMSSAGRFRAREEGVSGAVADRYFLADVEIELHGARWKGELAFERVSESPLVVAGEIVLSRQAFGIGRPHRWYNPFSIRDEIPVRFETGVPEY